MNKLPQITATFALLSSLVMTSCATNDPFMDELNHDDTIPGPKPTIEELRTTYCSELKRAGLKCHIA